MSILIGSVLLWAASLTIARKLWIEDREVLREALRRMVSTSVFIIPRVAVGLIGSGFLAELLPQDNIAMLFGKEAGYMGVMLASLFGPLTPGGPFVAFAIGAAALKAGASEAALIGYVTSWSLLCLNRDLVYELPVLGARFMRLRWLLALPVPFIIGALAMLLT
ncbi:MAG: hypothetical protein KTR19_05850 [Hyphomicrobiales bacterium]|nr:hypothetical protein [Hyphomicrobiales bacterium]